MKVGTKLVAISILAIVLIDRASAIIPFPTSCSVMAVVFMFWLWGACHLMEEKD